MREILFRGKIDPDAYSYDRKSEWVYGYYSKYSAIFFGRSVIEQENDDYAVFDETVGQYTGVTDRNGNKIFEKDVVKTNQYQQSVGTDTFTIEFIEGNYYLCHDGFTLWTLRSFIEGVEVIGNIFDNPELLKEVKE
jgi:uncharacterized phage protein (TIGR01671 family)